MHVFVVHQQASVHLVAHVQDKLHMRGQRAFAPFLLGFSFGSPAQPFVVRTVVVLMVAYHQHAQPFACAGGIQRMEGVDRFIC